MSDHPQYPNDTIVEALCEFRITLSPEHPWKPGLPVGLIARLSDSFPQVEPITEFGMEFSIGPQGPTQRVVQAPPKYRFSNAENNRLIQVSASLCVFNVLRPYKGWDDMKTMIGNHWPAVSDIIKLVSVDRIGLRYINKIPVPQPHVVKDWLKPTRYISEGIIDSRSPINARIEVRPSEDCQLFITVADIDPPNEPSSIIYDIDCVRIRQLSGKMDEIIPIIDDLHERIWEQFSLARTERLERFLEGQVK